MDVRLLRLRDDPAEYRMLENWCRQEAVYRAFEQRILNYDEICAKYRPRTLPYAACPVYMIERDGVPVGIIQYKRLAPDNEYGVTAENGIDIDLFIGEENCRGQGIGGKAIRLLMEMCAPDAAVLCPLASNKPAIRCYEKSGFAAQKMLQMPDTVGEMQTYLVMIKQ